MTEVLLALAVLAIVVIFVISVGRGLVKLEKSLHEPVNNGVDEIIEEYIAGQFKEEK